MWQEQQGRSCRDSVAAGLSEWQAQGARLSAVRVLVRGSPGHATYQGLRMSGSAFLSWLPDDYHAAPGKVGVARIAHFHKYKHFTERILLVVFSGATKTARTVMVATSQTM